MPIKCECSKPMTHIETSRGWHQYRCTSCPRLLLISRRSARLQWFLSERHAHLARPPRHDAAEVIHSL